MALLDMIIQRSISVPFERVASQCAGLPARPRRRTDLQFTFTDVAGEFLADPLAPTLKLAYMVPGSGKGSRCELVLKRDRRNEPFETSLAFKTVEGSPLPARMLNVLFDADDWFGSDAKVLRDAPLESGWFDRLESRFPGRDARRRSGPSGQPALSASSPDREGPHRVSEG